MYIIKKNNYGLLGFDNYLFTLNLLPINFSIVFLTQMYFEGYVKILGIEAGAYLNITTEAMEIYIYGKVWNLIYCEVYVSASYDYMAITDAHFYIRVIVDLRGLTDVRKVIGFSFR